MGIGGVRVKKEGRERECEKERKSIFNSYEYTVFRKIVYYNTLLTYSAILKLDEFSILIYSEMKLARGENLYSRFNFYMNAIFF